MLFVPEVSELWDHPPLVALFNHPSTHTVGADLCGFGMDSKSGYESRALLVLTNMSPDHLTGITRTQKDLVWKSGEKRTRHGVHTHVAYDPNID